MLPGNSTVIVGNVSRDPELRFANKIPVTNFGVVWSSRRTNRQTGEKTIEELFVEVVCWRQLAENVSESIYKGDRVVLFGPIVEKRWTNRRGEECIKIQIIADEVAPSLRYARCNLEKNN